MILILSQAYSDLVVDDVMDWLDRLGIPCVRLLGEDIDGPAALRFELAEDRIAARLRYAGREISAGEVSAVWFRSWLREWRQEGTQLVADLSPLGGRLQHDIRVHLTREGQRLGEFLFSCFDDKPWLSRPASSSPNKLQVLHAAARAGLAIPASLVTTERAALERFAAEHGELVTKPLSDTLLLKAGGRLHLSYTAVAPGELIARLPERFAPSLFQERLDKAYEIRVFFLDDECHSMAIFSQQDPRTAVDFRRYNDRRPNRMVPYLLDEATARGIAELMRALGLETGSLDLVRTRDGRDTFLEVNPLGQLGMVSRPCNYQLERKIAERLAAMAGETGLEARRTETGRSETLSRSGRAAVACEVQPDAVDSSDTGHQA